MSDKENASGLQIKQELKPINNANASAKLKSVKTTYKPVACNFYPVTDQDEKEKITKMMASILVRENKKAGYDMPRADIDQAMQGFMGCQLLLNKREDGTKAIIVLGHYEFNKGGEISHGYNCALLEANSDLTDYVEARFVSNNVDPE